jgi:hypothetical protein
MQKMCFKAMEQSLKEIQKNLFSLNWKKMNLHDDENVDLLNWFIWNKIVLTLLNSSEMRLHSYLVSIFSADSEELVEIFKDSGWINSEYRILQFVKWWYSMGTFALLKREAQPKT